MNESLIFFCRHVVGRWAALLSSVCRHVVQQGGFVDTGAADGPERLLKTTCRGGAASSQSSQSSRGRTPSTLLVHPRFETMATPTPPQSVLREFCPLYHLLNSIPDKVQKGFRSVLVYLTALDCSTDYIAVGSSIGVLYLYSRRLSHMDKHHLKGKSEAITAVKLLSCFDDLVAVGTASGRVTVFQLVSQLPGRNKQLRRFDVVGLHTSSVVCLAWSPNGAKLFSGDHKGRVVFTGLDLDKGECKPTVLLEEVSGIVQLEYSHTVLLVSSQQRALGRFGACFLPALCKQSDLQVLAARPGFRLWRADIQGLVEDTRLFKGLFSTPLGLLSCFHRDGWLLSWNEYSVYVIDCLNEVAIGALESCGDIVAVSSCQHEVFILKGDRDIIRISSCPEGQTPLSDLSASFSSPLTTPTVVSPPIGSVETAQPIRTMAIVVEKQDGGGGGGREGGELRKEEGGGGGVVVAAVAGFEGSTPSGHLSTGPPRWLFHLQAGPSKQSPQRPPLAPASCHSRSSSVTSWDSGSTAMTPPELSELGSARYSATLDPEDLQQELVVKAIRDGACSHGNHLTEQSLQVGPQEKKAAEHEEDQESPELLSCSPASAEEEEELPPPREEEDQEEFLSPLIGPDQEEDDMLPPCGMEDSMFHSTMSTLDQEASDEEEDIYRHGAPPTGDTGNCLNSVPTAGLTDEDEGKLKGDQLAECWMGYPGPGCGILSLHVTDRYVWCLDFKGVLFCSPLPDGGGLLWKVEQKSMTAYACGKVSIRGRRHWYKALEHAASVALGNDTAWVLRTNGDLYLQTGLSAERPCSRSVKVCAREGVVWALSEEGAVFYRDGLSSFCCEGEGWTNDKISEAQGLQLMCVSLGPSGVVWALDANGALWFRTGVSTHTPQGEDSHWWQISITDYVVFDQGSLFQTLLQATHSVATVTRTPVERVAECLRVAFLSQQATRQPSLVSANTSGVWIASGRNHLHVARGNLVELSQLSACGDALWGLDSHGSVHIRTLSPSCPTGMHWARLDLRQLGGVRLVSVSCGSQNVWAVDSQGMVYFRVGTQPLNPSMMLPAWICIEPPVQPVGVQLVSIHSSPNDRQLWALDNRGSVHVRTGLNEEMPVGTDWEQVPGLAASQLVLSVRTVWVRCPNGEIARPGGRMGGHLMSDLVAMLFLDS
ncbi:hypothetical protein CRUP_023036 [Coryphaenoides rupestris]|nr:hypothetical protein CRUP_023036 [Coryphaenoides rupestris]